MSMSSAGATSGNVRPTRVPIVMPVTSRSPSTGRSAGSSCCACTVNACGWLSPNASALRPGRCEARVDHDVERAGTVGGRAGRDRGRVHRRAPTVVENGTWNLSPVPADLVLDERVQALLRRRRDHLAPPPVAVSNVHTPAPTLVFGSCRPCRGCTARRTGRCRRTAGSVRRAPKISVSRSVNGPRRPTSCRQEQRPLRRRLAPRRRRRTASRRTRVATSSRCRRTPSRCCRAGRTGRWPRPCRRTAIAPVRCRPRPAARSRQRPRRPGRPRWSLFADA